MFRWCSYCQTFIGESEPKSNFTLTHGVCKNCKINTHNFTTKDIQGIQPIKHFFTEIQNSFLADEKFDKVKILSEAKKLNINPADLLAGVMQPLLYEIGKLYLEGKIPAVQEHHFSTFIKSLIYEIREEMLADDQTSKAEVDILLTVTSQNFHEFGISLLELHLKKSGFNVESLYPGLPPDELVKYAIKVKAKAVGISISMEEQLKEVETIAKMFSNVDSVHPIVIVGGFVVHENLSPIPGVITFSGPITDLVELMTQKIN